MIRSQLQVAAVSNGSAAALVLGISSWLTKLTGTAPPAAQVCSFLPALGQTRCLSATSEAAPSAKPTLEQKLQGPYRISTLKHMLKPATGRNRFRRMWARQAQIQANHQRRIRAEAASSQQKLQEQAVRWQLRARLGREARAWQQRQLRRAGGV